MKLLILSAVLLVIGDIIFRVWLDAPKHWIYAIGLMAYTISTMVMIETYKSNHIAIASIIITLINTVIVLVVFYLAYQEVITVKQLIGIGLAILSIYLMDAK